MTLPKWVQGPSKKPFIGKPCCATVYFNMNSKFSEVPYILATIQAASAFDAVKIVIPDTLEYQNMSLLPDNKNKEEQILYKELKGNGVAFYERNKAHFQPLIDKVGQQTWDNECVTYWDDYRLTSAFKDAKIIIQTICAHEKEESLEMASQQLNNNRLADDANIFSLNQAIELTAQKRLNCFWNVKNKKYDLTSPEALKFIDCIHDELAQLLVEVLAIKAKFELEKRENDSLDGHAILYADKLNPAMYKLFQLITARDEHKLMSKTNALLKPYKISENLMQPLSINWNAKDVKEILNQFQKSVVKQEDNIINASHIFNSQTIVRRNSGADAFATERQSSPPDGPSFEELFKQAFSMGAEIALKYPEDPQRVRAVADYSSRFLFNMKIMFFPSLAKQETPSKEENIALVIENLATNAALFK